jgi:hypothetical protein
MMFFSTPFCKGYFFFAVHSRETENCLGVLLNNDPTTTTTTTTNMGK